MADVTNGVTKAGATAPGLPLWTDHTAFLRRHRKWIGALMCLGLLLGYAWSLTQPKTFSATASVTLTPVPMYVTASTTEVAPPPVTIDTDAQLLHSPQVRDAVAEALGIPAAAVAGRLSVSATPSSHVLHVTVSSRSALKSAAAANAAVAALIEVRRDTLGSLQTEQLSHLQLAVQAQEHMLDRTAVLSSDNTLYAEVADLQNRVQELADAREHPATVISPAAVPRHRDYANTEVPVVSGAMLGLLLAWGLGLALDRSGQRRRVTSPVPLVRNPFGALPDAAILNESYHHAV
jgi:hypothetical protein